MTVTYRNAALAWPEQDFEVRAVGDGLEFRGYAAVFNSQSEDLGGFRETIAPGAFTRSVNAAANGSADVRMFWNHDSGRLLASTKAKTLRLVQDERGLLAEATLPETSDGRDMSALVRRGDVRSMSFGFAVDKGGDTWSQDHKERTLTNVRLFEVSPVTGWPAYSATSASVRHLMALVDWDEDAAIGELVATLKDEQRDSLRRHLGAGPTTSDDLAELYARLERKRAA